MSRRDPSKGGWLHPKAQSRGRVVCISPGLSPRHNLPLPPPLSYLHASRPLYVRKDSLTNRKTTPSITRDPRGTVASPRALRAPATDCTPLLHVSMCPGPCLVFGESEGGKAEREEPRSPTPTYTHQMSTKEEERSQGICFTQEPRDSCSCLVTTTRVLCGPCHIARPVSPSAAQHSPSTEHTFNNMPTEMHYGNLTG